ncbi:uncharacterized protein LOC141718789 [Apium graveolens]|uniref:uncharacterized protein LOC141718789 n=1 Tax=Apium graveolens TaxID=4045 RepID=UPI003D78DB9F
MVLRKPELTGRLAKWSIRLSTYDISYDARTTIKSQALADFVADFSPTQLTQAEEELKQVTSQVEIQPWTLYTDGASNANGTGLGLSATGTLQRCIEKNEADMVLRDVHEGDCGNYTNGRNLSLKILRIGYYWPTLRQDTIDYTKKCDTCQRHAPIGHQPSEFLHPSIPSWPFMKWGMDIVEKMPSAPGQKIFMLAMTDYFSTWI